MLGELLALAQPLGAGRDHEAGLAARPQLRVDDRGDDVHVGDAAVGGPGLGAVDDPLVVRLVVRRPGAHRADVAAGVRLGGAERRELEVARRAEHLRHPLADLLGRAVGRDRRPRPAWCRRWPGRSRRHPRTAPPWRPAARARSRRSSGWRRSRGSRGRSWRPPRAPATGTPRARPTRPRPAGRRPRRRCAPTSAARRGRGRGRSSACVGWSLRPGRSRSTPRGYRRVSPAMTSNVQLPTFSPPTYHVTRCLPVLAVAIVTYFFSPLSAGWALAHSRSSCRGTSRTPCRSRRAWCSGRTPPWAATSLHEWAGLALAL